MGDLDGLKANRPLHPEMPRVWGAWVMKNLLGIILDDFRITSSHPFHVNVAVALIVCGRNPQRYGVITLRV